MQLIPMTGFLPGGVLLGWSAPTCPMPPVHRPLAADARGDDCELVGSRVGGRETHRPLECSLRTVRRASGGAEFVSVSSNPGSRRASFMSLPKWASRPRQRSWSLGSMPSGAAIAAIKHRSARSRRVFVPRLGVPHSELPRA